MSLDFPLSSPGYSEQHFDRLVPLILHSPSESSLGLGQLKALSWPRLFSLRKQGAQVKKSEHFPPLF